MEDMLSLLSECRVSSWGIVSSWRIWKLSRELQMEMVNALDVED
jgi:hypothetical protein